MAAVLRPLSRPKLYRCTLGRKWRTAGNGCDRVALSFFTKLSQFLQAAVNVSRIHSIHIRADSYGMVVSARHTRCCDRAEITMTLAFLPFGMTTAAEEL